MGMAFEKLAGRYTGKAAKRYDAKRKNFPQWREEQEIVESFVRRLPRLAAVLDVPIGTGRYLKFYKAREFAVTGADISADMLALAQRKARRSGLGLRADLADITCLPYGDKSFDAVICTRLLNWLDLDRLEIAVNEISRVTRRHVILGVQYWRPIREDMSALLWIVTIVTQAAYRVRLRLQKDKPHVHSRRAVEGVLAANRLRIVDVRDDFSGGRWKWRGIRYAIYFLEEDTGRARESSVAARALGRQCSPV